MSIFKRLGLPEGASAEEIAAWASSCCVDPPECPGGACPECLEALLSAAFQREREAGKREVWERMMPQCRHLMRATPHNCCFIAGAEICRQDVCPLMKGEGES